MSVLNYLVGGLSVATGILVTSQSIVSLTKGAAWHLQLRRWARVRRAIKPRARRLAWNGFGIGLGLIVTGTLRMLSVGDPALSRLTLGALVALLFWQLAYTLMFLRQRRSAS